jgi:fructosamine-3-kinase
MRTSQMNGICNWLEIELHLTKVKNQSIYFTKTESVSGGCISQAWKVTDNRGKQYFVKTNEATLDKLFAVEADALEEISKNHCIRTPHVLAYGGRSGFSYLVLEYISLKSQIDQKVLGRQVAQMHQLTHPMNQFGWKQNNYIGSTPQINNVNNDWLSFWKNERLLYQLKLAKNNGYSTNSYDAGLKLAESLSLFFTRYSPKPSLLHGDLWGGNCASDIDDNPVIYDPALYYGDREADIAMTELFGGFSANFYDAYNDCYALDSDYKTRKTLYNLYHILNHFNLFGASYAEQAENMTKQLLSEN